MNSVRLCCLTQVNLSLIKPGRFSFSDARRSASVVKAKYGGMEASDVKRLKELEEENRRLKQMYADLSLKSQLQAEIIKKL
ncbi:transposase [Moraxella sp. CTOTU49803]|uniref:transposase n=1 Tax=Moraxella sp. CTOTU49803 TaxID=2953840 RepID=UPI0039183D55